MLYFILLLPYLRKGNAFAFLPKVFSSFPTAPLVSSVRRDWDEGYNDGPWFCHSLDCPDYDALDLPSSLATQKIELRRYLRSLWVSTDVQGAPTYDDAVKEGFMRLFDYIQGNNAERQKVEMTAPVRVQIVPGEGPACSPNLTVSFFVPRQLHGRPPTPRDARVYIDPQGESDFYVSSFGGWNDEKRLAKEIESLSNALTAAGVEDFETGYSFFAGYDSPFRFFNRHNEVWFQRTDAKK